MEMFSHPDRLSYYDDNDKEIAFVRCSYWAPGILKIESCHVDPAYRDQGLIDALMAEIVKKLREANAKCYVTATLAVSYFERHLEDWDVIYTSDKK